MNPLYKALGTFLLIGVLEIQFSRMGIPKGVGFLSVFIIIIVFVTAKQTNVLIKRYSSEPNKGAVSRYIEWYFINLKKFFKRGEN